MKKSFLSLDYSENMTMLNNENSQEHENVQNIEDNNTSKQLTVITKSECYEVLQTFKSNLNKKKFLI